MFNIKELRNTSVESPVYLVYSQCEAILPSCGNQKLSQPAGKKNNNTVREDNTIHMCNLKKKAGRRGKGRKQNPAITMQCFLSEVKKLLTLFYLTVLHLFSQKSWILTLESLAFDLQMNKRKAEAEPNNDLF